MNSGCHIFTDGFQPQTSNSSNGSGQTVQKQIWDHEAVFQFEFWRFFGPFFFPTLEPLHRRGFTQKGFVQPPLSQMDDT